MDFICFLFGLAPETGLVRERERPVTQSHLPGRLSTGED